MAWPPAVVERQSRRHRAILFLHAAVVDGDPEAALARLYRRLRRLERSVSRLGLSGRHARRFLRQLLVESKSHHQSLPGQWRTSARAELRLESSRAAASNLRRFLARALRRRAPARDRGAALFDRRVGQDRPAY